ncbi:MULTISPECIES: MFS transporter [Pseudomonas]|jgi:predicted MFS family arabinose efflux permease|uniref:MFS transporter n=1 Tax=Pseudomonas coleopterorum TaxID=1605838 RepID=A0ABR9BY24_9PSED|nr:MULTISPECIES: MFS transporter [Pseudomonas]KQQ63397.1 MFS transporter [Pseudomonas sp. Leaf129]MBD8753906.1 MFS transporter [Pseudomonas coleopterorum]MBD8770001.1 MFS transporter [Pseudomonas coleopterorum]SEE30002.1 Nitrate/nitrite transporter NarK [Pseudomonas coleopterorum]
MSSSSTYATAAPGRREQFSTRIAFFIAGFAMAAWAPLVPLAKARAELSDGSLGLLLLGLGAGSILAMPLSGYLCARWGCRRVIVGAGVLICLMLPLLATAGTLPLLIGAVLLFGAGMGAIDCAMNIQAVLVEKASGRPMMSGFHGLFSVGGILGAGGMTALLALGLTPLLAVACVVAVTLLAVFKAAPHLLPYGNESDGPLFAMPRGIVLFLGALCFIVFLTEGAMLDWSAVFLVSERDMQPAYAGLGYAAFATAMTIGRLTGDRIVARFGGARVTLFGGLCAAAGLALSLAIPAWPAALLGYALIGAGCSNIVPVLFTAVGRQTTMPQSAAIPAMTSLGYAGILVGPAFIGFVAHGSSLSIALGVLIVLLLFVAASGRYLRN